MSGNYHSKQGYPLEVDCSLSSRSIPKHSDYSAEVSFNRVGQGLCVIQNARGVRSGIVVDQLSMSHKMLKYIYNFSIEQLVGAVLGSGDPD